MIFAVSTRLAATRRDRASPFPSGVRRCLRTLILLVGSAILLPACTILPSGQTEPRSVTRLQTPAVSESFSIRIAAVGDIMLGTDYPESRLPEAGGGQLLAPVAGVLRNADLSFGNLEGVLLDGGEPEKKCRSSACYVFRSPSSYAKYLADAGFDVVSVANNHARDFGDRGREATIQALNRHGIRYTGRQGDIATFEVQGRQIAVIAFAPFGDSWSMLDIPAAENVVRRLADTHDIVIVSFHGGAEGEEYTRIPFASETFHGEDRGDVVRFARAVVDAGADLVLGHGPHVPRALELYRGRLVAYSLGNFCTHWGIKVSGYNGFAPILLAELGPDGALVGGRIVSGVQRRPQGTLPDPEMAAARLMRDLSELDFPDSPLRVGSRGELKVPQLSDSSVTASASP